jgi:hypothetical protein
MSIKRRGRPSTYVRYADSIVFGIAHGFQTREVAQALGLPVGRIDIWLQQYPDFKSAIEAARRIAAEDRRARLRALYRSRPSNASVPTPEHTAAIPA